MAEIVTEWRVRYLLGVTGDFFLSTTYIFRRGAPVMTDRIQEMLSGLEPQIAGAWIVGSAARGEKSPSDLDVLIQPRSADAGNLLHVLRKRIGARDKVERLDKYEGPLKQTNPGSDLPLHLIICGPDEENLFPERMPIA